MSGKLEVEAALFLLAGFFALMFLVGYRTRFAAFVSWFLMLSLQARNPLVLQGSDRLLNLLLFWSLFLPLGARLSFDQALAPSSHQKLPDPVLSIGSAAYFTQIVLVYWITAARKLFAAPLPVWKEGLGIYYSLSVDQFATPLGSYLLHFPFLLKFLNYTILGFEIVGPLLLFSPFATVPVRMAALLGFLLLQVGFRLCLEVGLFPWIALAAMLPFLPAAFWNKISWPLERFETWWQQFAATLKKQFSNLAFLRPWCGRLLALFCLIYVLVWNTENVNPQYGVPRPLRWFGIMFGLDQRWAMFASPPQSGGWYVIQGKLKNESLVDLYKDGRPLSWEKPPLVSATFKDQYWRKYMESLLRPTHSKARLYFAQYLCREWNGSHKGDTLLRELKIYFMSEKTLSNNPEAAPKIKLLWSHQCFPPVKKEAPDKPEPAKK